ncbi:hypothetical protein [Pedobacter ghigonis]|uniref:hypothetical protein n=1 Tax=Pedobacter ghigonis TaxID=2730403 RepID=UPI0015891502|nr:hypothetical protein [Pedobacter ghigonis]
MAKFINWKRNWLNGNLQLFVDGIQKGALTFEMWKSNAYTLFEDKDYAFENKGFWQSTTTVTDRKTNEIVAIITYDSWKSKAIISLKSGEQYEWKATSSWRSEWTVSNNKDTHIYYQASSNTGAISTQADNNLLIVAGLFIKQIYNKKTAVMVACFVPIITATLTRHHG